jgi:hypothetical protein
VAREKKFIHAYLACTSNVRDFVSVGIIIVDHITVVQVAATAHFWGLLGLLELLGLVGSVQIIKIC